MPRSHQNKKREQATEDAGQEKTVKSRLPTSDPRPLLITPALLRRWALPQPDEEGDKEERGRVLVVGGATGMPGA
ncbi:MAG: hypothetical protein H0U54_19495, partial [Acidobacteria bacterium]|nr:hypothetical protein [Acidobacteriota bacterium]